MAGVFARRGDELVALREAPYEEERVLQELIERFPALLAADDGEPWLLVKREAGVRFGDLGDTVGALDHLFLDADGMPTLVEVKRASDTRSRREVVAQILDYAANARYDWGRGRLRTWIEERAAAAGDDAEALVRDAFESVDDVDAYWDQVERNLAADRLRLVFVADEVPASLRRIVEYLNEQMTQTEVLAIEVRQFVDEHGDHQMLVPTVIGRTAAADATKSTRASRRWDRGSVLAHLRETTGDGAAETATRLMAWADGLRLSSTYGRGKVVGSWCPGVDASRGDLWPFVVYSNGDVEIGFVYMARRQHFSDPALRDELRQRLNEIDGIDLATDSIERRPTFRIDALSTDAGFSQFTRTVEWALQQAASSTT
jgi:hypothetical protein